MEVHQVKTRNKKFCPDCLKKRIKERSKAASYQRLQEEKESNAIKAAAKLVEKYENAAYEAQKAHDAEIDARSRKQIQLQCRKCKYRLQCGNYTVGCDFISWKGHSTDKGNGPGDCRSSEPLTKETKAERTARRKRAITISEADKAQYTGEKMREVNQL
jgi:hypothetical protein